MTDEIRTDNTETLENALARIAELEEEKAELIEKANERYRGCQRIDDENNKTILNLEVKVKDLEKENAELKEKLDFISKNSESAGKMLVDMVKSEVEKAGQTI